MQDSTSLSKVEILTLRFLLIEQCPCDSYAWKYRELATLLTLSAGLAEGGFELLTTDSVRKSFTDELNPDTKAQCEERQVGSRAK